MSKLSGIYRIRNIVDGKRYYGQSSDIKHRFQQHKTDLRRGCHDNSKLQRAWNKHGGNSFVFEIIAELSIERLKEEELKILAREVGNQDCYNIVIDATVPMRGRKHSEETRRKIREKRALQPGRTYTPEQRQEVSDRMRGVPKSAAHRRKLSEAFAGSKHPLFGISGIAHPAFGNKWSEEMRAKMTIVINTIHKKPVEQLDPESGVIIRTFESVGEAAKAVGVSYQYLGRCCRTPSKRRSKNMRTAGGYGWRFKEREYENRNGRLRSPRIPRITRVGV